MAWYPRVPKCQKSSTFCLLEYWSCISETSLGLGGQWMLIFFFFHDAHFLSRFLSCQFGNPLSDTGCGATTFLIFDCTLQHLNFFMFIFGVQEWIYKNSGMWMWFCSHRIIFSSLHILVIVVYISVKNFNDYCIHNFFLIHDCLIECSRYLFEERINLISVMYNLVPK